MISIFREFKYFLFTFCKTVSKRLDWNFKLLAEPHYSLMEFISSEEVQQFASTYHLVSDCLM